MSLDLAHAETVTVDHSKTAVSHAPVQTVQGLISPLAGPAFRAPLSRHRQAKL